MYSKVDRSALPGNDRRTNELAKVDLPPPPKPTRLSPCQSFLILSCNQPVTQPVDGNHASQDPTFSLPDLPVQVARLLQVEYASSRAHEMHRYPLLPMHLLPGHADIHSQVPARLPAMLGRWARNHALYRQQKSRVSELKATHYQTKRTCPDIRNILRGCRHWTPNNRWWFRRPFGQPAGQPGMHK